MDIVALFTTTLPAIALTLVCAISVCLGWLLPLHRFPLTPRLFCLFTSFAAGMMACLGVAALMEACSLLAVVLFGCGWATMMGIEHLLHRNEHAVDQATPCTVSACLGPAVALGMHNLPECFFVLNTAMGNLSLGAGLALAMILHNIPLGISLGLAGSRMRASLRAFSTLLAGIAPVAVACCLEFFLQSIFSAEAIEHISPFAAGALCVIALRQLLPQARQHGPVTGVAAGFGLGIAVLCLILTTLHDHIH